ncbi:MAG: hypothetical protein HQK78_18695, partial [Desulfobacterales bacterium]|nr:hypothetical protein [Desulfobacterales bacterium]
MDIGNFLKELTLKGTKLWVKEDKLKYEGFKGSITPEILDKLKKYKLDIIKYLKERSEYKEPFPLSFGQQGLWYQYHIAPESPAYNLVYLSYLQPELDIILLDECFKIMFKRYSILSAKYEDKDEICFQKLQDIEKIKLEIIDASLWTEDELNEWIENDEVVLSADVEDRDAGVNMDFYFELINVVDDFTEDETEPVGACVSGTDYDDCASSIWTVNSLVASNNASGQVNIPALPENI